MHVGGGVITYAEVGKRLDLSLRDRILIFEDRDGTEAPIRGKCFPTSSAC